MQRITYIFSLLLLGYIFVVPTTAQTQLPEWLPSQPLRKNAYVHESTLIWLDNQTVIFESSDESMPRKMVTSRYDVASGQLELLDSSPLYLELTPELIEHYQSRPDIPIYQSPFATGSATPLIYESRLAVDCGHECGGGLVMVGEHNESPTEIPGIGTYRPIADLFAQCGVQVNWGRSNVAVVHVGLCYGWGWNYYLVRPNETERASRLPLHIGGNGDIEQHVLAISNDGNRVLYESFPSDYGTSPESRYESLYYWQSTNPTESHPLSVVERVIEITAQDMKPNPFAAANFIPDNTHEILAVHSDGLIRIDIEIDEREVLNPDINSTWVRLGYFSPDNRHIAVVTWDGGLYVIETGIG